MAVLARTRKASFPMVLFLVAFIVLPVGLTFLLRKLSPSAQILGVLFGVGYIAWVVIERRVTFGTARESKSPSDRGTLQFYGIARVVTMLAALFVLPTWQIQGPWLVCTFVVFVAGVALRLNAIQHLGRFYSHQVRSVDAHQVIQDGPYQRIRHPAYAGMLIAHAGVVGFFCNPISCASLLGLFVPAVILRIVIEEQMLLREVSGYAAYARTRKRLIPVVW